MKRWSILFLFVAASLAGTAQAGNISSYFKASEIQGKVLLTWQITSGNTCDGIQIYRGTDSTQLNLVGEILGICGSVTEPIDYSFVDETLTKNATYYYRLEFGTQGFSKIITITVNSIISGTSQVRPNPIYSTGKIFFSKPNDKPNTLRLYNKFGQVVLEKTTTDNFFDINAVALKNGIYVYTITTDASIVLAKEKLLVQH